jgi:hypothetical protein
MMNRRNFLKLFAAACAAIPFVGHAEKTKAALLPTSDPLPSNGGFISDSEADALVEAWPIQPIRVQRTAHPGRFTNDGYVLYKYSGTVEFDPATHWKSLERYFKEGAYWPKLLPGFVIHSSDGGYWPFETKLTWEMTFRQVFKTATKARFKFDRFGNMTALKQKP